MTNIKEKLIKSKPDTEKAFDGLLPGNLLSEYDPSEPSAFEKLTALLNRYEDVKILIDIYYEVI